MEDTTMGYREDFFKANPGTKIPGKRGLCWRCINCGGWFPKSEIDVDHRIAKRLGGTDDIWNLQSMCKHCNRSKRERSSSGEIAQTVVTGAVSGLVNGGLGGGFDNLAKLGKSVATQKIKDALGIKYRR